MRPAVSFSRTMDPIVQKSILRGLTGRFSGHDQPARQSKKADDFQYYT